MYSLKVAEEIEIKHHLNLNYPSVENQLHSHKWVVMVSCWVDKLNENDKISDEYTIKKLIKQYDKVVLNDYIENPTPEEFMKKLLNTIPFCRDIRIFDNTNSLEYRISLNGDEQI